MSVCVQMTATLIGFPCARATSVACCRSEISGLDVSSYETK